MTRIMHLSRQELASLYPFDIPVWPPERMTVKWTKGEGFLRYDAVSFKKDEQGEIQAIVAKDQGIIPIKKSRLVDLLRKHKNDH